MSADEYFKGGRKFPHYVDVMVNSDALCILFLLQVYKSQIFMECKHIVFTLSALFDCGDNLPIITTSNGFFLCVSSIFFAALCEK